MTPRTTTLRMTRRLLLLLLSSVLWSTLAACRADAPVASVASPTAPPPAAASATATPDAQAEIDRTLALVAERTAALFEAESSPQPAVTLLDEPALGRLIDELLAEPEAVKQIAAEAGLYRLLGLIPPDLDLAALYRDVYTAGVAGLYRPEERQVYVRLFGRFAALEEATASHEYTHYLQDLYHDLERMQDEVSGDRDRAMALQALIEGHATHVQQRYVAEHFNMAQAFSMGFSGMLAASRGPDVPLVLQRDSTFVYLDGLAFVARTLEAGYSRDDLFASPPVATAQVLHPDRYVAGDGGRAVELVLAEAGLPAGWSAGPAGTLGELLVRTWLEELGSRIGVARSAAAGWDGDAVRVLSDGGGAVAVVAQIAWQTPGDAGEFVEAAWEALDEHPEYEPLLCVACGFPAWEGRAGTVALLSRISAAGSSVLVVVAPSLDEVRQLADALQ